MSKIKRICVPLSLDCNLHCKYCYRDHDARPETIPEFSKEMIEYLGQLSPDSCEAVIASGGEPLFHWDKVKELFSYVPKGIHKKIMSNCVFLTQEIVDYINENEVELSASHDGRQSKFLRGVDILADDKLADLVRQVKILRVVSVVTKYNPDVWDNFFDTATRLKRSDFNYHVSPLLDCPEQQYLVENMDYDTWFTTWSQFLVSPYHHILPYYFGKTLKKKDPSKKPFVYKYGKHGHFNVLPDGTVCEMQKITENYGKVWDSFEDLYEQMLIKDDFSYCAKCEYNQNCNFNIPCYSAHTLKIRLMSNAFLKNPEKKMALRKYVLEHLHEIEEKYHVDRDLIGANHD